MHLMKRFRTLETIHKSDKIDKVDSSGLDGDHESKSTARRLEFPAANSDVIEPFRGSVGAQ